MEQKTSSLRKTLMAAGLSLAFVAGGTGAVIAPQVLPNALAATTQQTITWYEGQSMPSPQRTITSGGITYKLSSVGDPELISKGQTESKSFQDVKTANLGPNDRHKAEGAFPNSVSVNSDGYSGQIPRVNVEVKEQTEPTTIPLSHVITIITDSDDRGELDQSITKDGVEMRLVNASFREAGDGKFEATVEYAGEKTVNKTVGYTATATYQGTLTKKVSANKYSAKVVYESVAEPSSGGSSSSTSSTPSRPAPQNPSSSNSSSFSSAGSTGNITSSAAPNQRQTQQQQQNQGNVVSAQNPPATPLGQGDIGVSAGTGITASGAFSELGSFASGSNTGTMTADASNMGQNSSLGQDMMAQQEGNPAPVNQQPETDTALLQDKDKYNPNSSASPLDVIKDNLAYVLGGIAVLLAAGTGIFFVVKRNKKNNEVEGIEGESREASMTPPSAADALGNDDLFDAIDQAQQTQLLDDHTQLIPTAGTTKVMDGLDDSVVASPVEESEPVLYMGELIEVDAEDPDQQQTLATLTIEPNTGDDADKATNIVIPAPPASFSPQDHKDYYIVLNTVDGLNPDAPMAVFVQGDEGREIVVGSKTTDQIYLPHEYLSDALYAVHNPQEEQEMEFDEPEDDGLDATVLIPPTVKIADEDGNSSDADILDSFLNNED